LTKNFKKIIYIVYMLIICKDACNGFNYVNYIEMFSLLGVSMEGRVWFEDKLYEDKILQYIMLAFISFFEHFLFSKSTDIDD